jgi:phosphoadenosine phosphosulfate reductase
MKTVVFNQWFERHRIKGVFKGLRWGEHPARFYEEYLEKMDTVHLVPEHTRNRPILHFTEKDLWDYHYAFKIPYCQL